MRITKSHRDEIQVRIHLIMGRLPEDELISKASRSNGDFAEARQELHRRRRLNEEPEIQLLVSTPEEHADVFRELDPFQGA